MNSGLPMKQWWSSKASFEIEQLVISRLF
jgi:hypothetical protein